MRLEIMTDPTYWGTAATQADAAVGVEWMEDVARALHLTHVEDYGSGTDEASEVWAEDCEQDEDEDVSERAYALWCDGLTPAAAAARIRGTGS